MATLLFKPIPQTLISLGIELRGLKPFLKKGLILTLNQRQEYTAETAVVCSDFKNKARAAAGFSMGVVRGKTSRLN
jgi:hypothetical protein